MMRRSYADTPRGQVHLRRAGHGPETVLLLHQTAASSAMYEAFAAEFLAAESAKYTLIAVDTPGFGMSFTPEDPYDLGDWADDLLAAVEGPMHVLGHHTGASIAVAMAARAAERIASLTMIGATVLPDAERARWEAGVVGMQLADSGAHLSTAWWQVANIDGDPNAYPPSLALRQRETVDKLRAGSRWHEAYLTVFRTDVRALLASSTAPALLICGTADVLYPYVASTLAARDGITSVELDAGAYVLDQEPAAVVAPLLDFLAAHPIAGEAA
ncbi:alpha/beta hydrolase [Microbacteriaceae bacterium VKM Ac-2855]|nr:alpha/beta hydrolase [Microbacteriaceae bacterium VKM Ac-2855]